MLLLVMVPCRPIFAQNADQGEKVKPPAFAFLLALDWHDKNRNGNLDPIELRRIFLPKNRNLLLALDLNEDGTVEKSEVRQIQVSHLVEGHRRMLSQIWGKIDSDGDGTLSREESERNPGLNKLFLGFNRDGDDTLSFEEKEQMEGFFISLVLKKAIAKMQDAVGKHFTGKLTAATKVYLLLFDYNDDNYIDENEFSSILRECLGNVTCEFILGIRTFLNPSGKDFASIRKGGTRPLSTCEVNSQVSIPAIGRGAPSNIPSKSEPRKYNFLYDQAAAQTEFPVAPPHSVEPVPDEVPDHTTTPDGTEPDTVQPDKPVEQVVTNAAANTGKEPVVSPPVIVTQSGPGTTQGKAPVSSPGKTSTRVAKLPAIAQVKISNSSRVKNGNPKPATSTEQRKRKVLVVDNTIEPMTQEEEYDLVKDLLQTAGSEDVLW